jgi:hypothetical protein
MKNGKIINDRFEKEVQLMDIRGLSKGIWVYYFFKFNFFLSQNLQNYYNKLSHRYLFFKFINFLNSDKRKCK